MIEINETTFGTVIDSQLPVLLEFYGTSCPPCQRIRPMLERLSVELQGQALIAKMSVENNPRMAHNCGIGSVPTFIVFVNGGEKARMIGIQSRENILTALGLPMSPQADLFHK